MSVRSRNKGKNSTGRGLPWNSRALDTLRRGWSWETVASGLQIFVWKVLGLECINSDTQVPSSWNDEGM
jgi:hypothetical protein